MTKDDADSENSEVEATEEPEIKEDDPDSVDLPEDEQNDEDSDTKGTIHF